MSFARQPMKQTRTSGEPSLPEPRAHRDYVTVDGKRLETVRYPPSGKKPTIVMLHEGLGSISMWKDFPGQLAKSTGCGVLVYSRYGHGKSERLAEKRSIDFMHHEAQVVLPGLLERCEIEAPILLGHSDGGSISIIYAATAARKPRALLLEAPHVFVEDLSVSSISKIRTAYETMELRQKLARYHDHVDETFWGWNDIWLDPRFRSWNIEGYLNAIRCPVLVIQGENDEYGTLAQVEAIKACLPSTKTLVLPECGHSPHRDQPASTLGAISRFVRSVTELEKRVSVDF
jgi:pimeloyl-ACP methyl ester carboxylesterase